MDPIFPVAVLSVSSLVNNLVSSAKNAKELAKQSGDSELKEQIVELFDSILDIKQRFLDLDAENSALRDQLKRKASVKRDPTFGYYFANDDPDPFCPKCHESSDKLIHLTGQETAGDIVRRRCIVCSTSYTEGRGNQSMRRIVPRVDRY